MEISRKNTIFQFRCARPPKTWFLKKIRSEILTRACVTCVLYVCCTVLWTIFIRFIQRFLAHLTIFLCFSVSSLISTPFFCHSVANKNPSPRLVKRLQQREKTHASARTLQRWERSVCSLDSPSLGWFSRITGRPFRVAVLPHPPPAREKKEVYQ